jgi:hypothetical protein
MTHSTPIAEQGQGRIFATEALPDEPTPDDRDWHAQQNDDWHDLDEPTPSETLDEPGEPIDYDDWPDWAQEERWTLSDAEWDRLAEEAKSRTRIEQPNYL